MCLCKNGNSTNAKISLDRAVVKTAENYILTKLKLNMNTFEYDITKLKQVKTMITMPMVKNLTETVN
jgi:hypothetical protein